VDTLVLPASQRIAEFERPQKVVGSLEARAARVNFMDQILHADYALLAEVIRNDLVIRQRYSLFVHLGEPALVDELADGLQGRLSIRDIRLDVREHRHSSKVHFDKSGTVQLKQPKELQNFLGFGRYTHDSPNADD